MKITFLALVLLGLVSSKHHQLHAVDAKDLSTMKSEMEEFSKDFSKDHFTTSWNAYVNARDSGYKGDAPKIETWEKYDKAFKTMRARKTKFTRDQLDKLQELQEEVNGNPTDQEAINAFARGGIKIRDALKNKYPSEFADPATDEDTMW